MHRDHRHIADAVILFASALNQGINKMSRAPDKRKVILPKRFENVYDDSGVVEDGMPASAGISGRAGAIAGEELHSTKNHRISGASRSAHAREHFQSGIIDKAPLEKMASEDSGGRVIATWPPIAGATMYETKYEKASMYHIVEEEIEKYPLALSYTERSKDGAPTEGAVKLKEKLLAEGLLVCSRCKVVFGAKVCDVEGNEIGSLGVSSFQLDHIDPKRPTMSQKRSFEAYLQAWNASHIVAKCYECIGLEYQDQGMDRVGNCRNYKARA